MRASLDGRPRDTRRSSGISREGMSSGLVFGGPAHDIMVFWIWEER
jgi:hypothetical protein